jgi:hypothetical protein
VDYPGDPVDEVYIPVPFIAEEARIAMTADFAPHWLGKVRPADQFDLKSSMCLGEVLLDCWKTIKQTTVSTEMANKKKKKTPVKMVMVPAMSVKKKKRRSRKKKGSMKGSVGALSKDGNAFLKCTMAPCDFVNGATGFVGIPDEYDGRVIVDSLTSVNSLPSYTAGQDLYIIQPPIPGVAYMWGAVAGGTRFNTAITFTPVWYSDINTLFPSGVGGPAILVDKFRVASNVIELVNTTNDMVWSGSLEAFKIDLTLTTGNDTVLDQGTHVVNFEFPIISGFDGLYTSEPGYVNRIKDGVYMAAFNQQSTYPWSPVQTGLAFTELSTNAALLGTTSQNAFMTFANVAPNLVVGMGSLETNVIRIPAIAASQAMRIRTWTCVEYTTPSTSVLYNYSHFSPPYDPVAISMLKVFHHELPMAVTAAQNATFWENVRKWIGRATKLGGFLPGPVGTISTLANGLVKSGNIGFSLDA